MVSASERRKKDAGSVQSSGGSQAAHGLLDMTDKRILSLLNAHVRMPAAQIAKRTRLSKEVVQYRIHRLLREGVIHEFVTVFGFGYWANKVLLAFSTVGPSREREVVKLLAEHPYVNWVTPCLGSWDLVFSVMAHDPSHFQSVLQEILRSIGPIVRDYKVATSVGSETYGHTYLLGTVKEPEQVVRKTPVATEFDGKDKLIARVLRNHARASLADISRETGIPIDTVKYRIKKMERNSIIRRYRLILNSDILGYTRYELFLRCVNLSPSIVSQFKEYAKQTPNIEFFSRCVGSWDIEFTVHVKEAQELRRLILDIKQSFGESIQSLEAVTLFKTQNFVYFPQELR